MKAKIEIECENPEIIVKAIKPDMDEQRFRVELKANDNKIKIKVKAKDISSLLAGINSYVRLIKSSIGALK
ncbi:MAG: KEOPS complex subunit Pcc1 [Candidatus Aenigmatarchaeota archaeon]